MSKTKDDLTTLVILAERAERYSDMFNYMLDLIKLGGELSEEDRNLLSVACKNTIGPKRSSIRCLAMLEEKHAKDSLKLECVKELREIVVSEMAKVCNTLVEILTAHVLAKASSPADNVFYQKMVGDYYRYLAEALKGDARSEASAKALDAYNKARELATSGLKPSNPIRLGLLLNLSVYYYEIENDVKKAQNISREALDGAEERTGEDPEMHKDCELILQLLRDNLTLWNSEAAMSSSSEEESTAEKFDAQ